ncbi:MAG: extracellular solute-binding protein [bacterium]|nr:extracellular solute-binding protein [bacterium]
MDGDTVFNNTSVNQQPVPIQQENIEVVPPQDSSPSILGKILKVFIALVVLFLIGFLVFSFLLPRFSPKKDEKVTLTYWGLWEDKRTMASIISDFERQNPNITVDYVKQDVKDYRERVVTRINNGTGPDLFPFHSTWLPMFSDLLLPLPQDTINKNDLQNYFYPVSQKDLVKNGAIYGIPLSVDTLSLFINKESFAAAGLTAPKTWEEFSRISRTLTVKDENGNIKNAGAALGTFDNITHAPDIISLLMVQNGADLKNLSGTSQNTIDALNFYVQFAKEEDRVWDEKLANSINVFAQGNLSMYFGYSWDIFTIKALNPNLNFEVDPVPHLPGRNTTIASYWPDGVSVKSKHQKEALMFLKFLYQKEVMQKLYSEESKTRLFGELYGRKDLAENLKSNNLIYPFVDQAKDSSSSFFASDTSDNGLNSQANVYLGNAVRSMLGNTSADSAVEVLAKGVAQVLAKYGQ